jgi:hypothetical protein
LARRFSRILAAPVDAYPGWGRSWPPRPQHDRRWLAAFFADEPEWELLLCRWIADVLSSYVG